MKPATTPDWPLRQAIFLGLLVLLSRLPFLGQGYGSDADAWRAIQAGQHLLDTGRYLPSRPPGYPLPEYLLALLLYAGIATPWVTGLISAALSGVAASLIALVMAPLGWWRSTVAAIALAFTPVVFIASMSAMDYIWGLTFFLAATLCVLKARWMWAAVWLGLAAACRPTYAVSFLPLSWAGLRIEGLSWRSATAWRRLIPMALLSGSITLAFFVPVIEEIGWRVVAMPAHGHYSMMWLLYSSTSLLFGLIGSVAVALAVVAALWRHRECVPLSTRQGQSLTVWSWLLIALYVLLFLMLPDEASYLMPALLGFYTLLARYSPRAMLAVLVVAMVMSSFMLSIARDANGRAGVVAQGPVLREINLQRRRACVAHLIKDYLEQAPVNERIIAAEYRPQVMMEIGPVLAKRILYTVTRETGNRLYDEELGPLSPGLHLTLLDRAQIQQESAMPLQAGTYSRLETSAQCP